MADQNNPQDASNPQGVNTQVNASNPNSQTVYYGDANANNNMNTNAQPANASNDANNANLANANAPAASPAPAATAEAPATDASLMEKAKERIDVASNPDVVSGAVEVDSEADKEFQALYEERVVLPRHEMQDGVRNQENREVLKDAGIKAKGFNNDLHKLNIERVLSKNGGEATTARAAKAKESESAKAQKLNLQNQAK